ncbi:PX domain-containing protein [Podospora fimiseda]|uniref:Endosomal/vacuolar adapter protein YPT35 n=1 Tax=Podospora fimiseda TaxID=252190 RepID=A0AAN7BY78_9PEZI|nr:PX domain-containing protein [Podospora fimiseda]
MSLEVVSQPKQQQHDHVASQNPVPPPYPSDPRSSQFSFLTAIDGVNHNEPTSSESSSSPPQNANNASSEPEPEPEINSPSSITSPPYWQQTHLSTNQSTTTRHNRGLSTSSVESILPPGAITLQDNEDEGDNSETTRYSRDRNRACWAKSVNVVDYVLVNGSATNLGAFVVWNIKVETLTGSKINIRKRYSEFDDLRKKLIQTFPNFEAAVPSLPPKSVLNKFKTKFLEKRRGGLQYFLNCILLNPEFSGSPVLKEFLFS